MWKQQIGSPSDPSVQDRFEKLFLSADAPEDHALFSRSSDDLEFEIFLISPAAVRWAELLGGTWVDAPNALRYQWTVLVAATDVERKFGIKIGSPD